MGEQREGRIGDQEVQGTVFWNRFAPFARYSNNARKLEVVAFVGRR